MNNRTIYLIAGLLAAAAAAIAAVLIFFPGKSAPGESAKPGQLDMHEVSLPVTTVLDAQPEDPGNAGDDYYQAVRLCKDNARALRDNVEQMERGRAPSADVLALLQKVDALCTSAAAKARMNYSVTHGLPKPEIVYYQPMARDLKSVGGALYDLAMYQFLFEKKPADALRTFRHQFALGYHMAAERVHVTVVIEGLETMARACKEIAAILDKGGPDDAKKAQAVREYCDKVEEVLYFYRHKYEYLCSLKANPGDIFNVVENDQDPAWRLQGIIGLGIVKFTAERRGDAKYAASLIEKTLKDGNDLEKATAAAARDLTVDEFRLVPTRYTVE